MGTEALSRISPAALPYLQPLSPTAKFRKHRVLYSLRIALERVRQHHGLCVYGYVVMPEHVHLLVNEPEPGTLAQAMQSLKQRGEAGLTRGRPVLAGSLLRFKRLERAQVRGETSFHPPQSREAWVGRAARGLDLEQLRHYLNGQAGPVEIESQWTARRREHAGIFPIVVVRPLQKTPAPAHLGRGTLESRNAR